MQTLKKSQAPAAQLSLGGRGGDDGNGGQKPNAATLKTGCAADAPTLHQRRTNGEKPPLKPLQQPRGYTDDSQVNASQRQPAPHMPALFQAPSLALRTLTAPAASAGTASSTNQNTASTASSGGAPAPTKPVLKRKKP